MERGLSIRTIQLVVMWPQLTVMRSKTKEFTLKMHKNKHERESTNMRKKFQNAIASASSRHLLPCH